MSVCKRHELDAHAASMCPWCEVERLDRIVGGDVERNIDTNMARRALTFLLATTNRGEMPFGVQGVFEEARGCIMNALDELDSLRLKG